MGRDLVSVQNKSPDDLLIAILDPNREALADLRQLHCVDRRWQGLHRAHRGRDGGQCHPAWCVEAKEDVVLRNQLDALVSNGVSLMPEGMEKISPRSKWRT